jgi:hypothetical protein
VAFFLFFLTLSCYSQHLDRTIYEEKTKEITQPFPNLDCFKKVNVLSFVEYRLYFDERAQQNIVDSAFNSLYAENPLTYVSYKMLDTLKRLDLKDKNLRVYKKFPYNDSIFKNYFKYEIPKKLNNYIGMGVNRPIIPKQDSLVLITELHNLKDKFKSSEIKEFKIGDELYNALKQNSCDVVIVFDALMYNNKIAYPRTVNTSTILRVFIFDMRSRELILYNYKTAYDANWMELFSIGSFGSIPGRFKKLLRPVKELGKANKRKCRKA